MNNSFKIISVVGARPNFMKIAPIHKAITAHNEKIDSGSESGMTVEHLICHTGQHYDEKMSKVFFDELELPKPDFYLGIGGGSHAEQTGRVMIEFEKVLIKEKSDLVIVVGDVNSTIACSLAAVKLGIKVAHVEAGLRSNDRTMPEEINRILTDSIADFLFVTEKSGLENLKKEGIPDDKFFFVGNVMIDSLINYLSKTENSKILSTSHLEPGTYCLVTLHRPSNVDNPEHLVKIITLLNRIAKHKKVVFPVHPRTKKNIENNSTFSILNSAIIFSDPLGYIDFLALMKNAALVLTDSGGIQEETTFLGIPCVTLRKTTERPITSEIGTNYIVGDDFSNAEIIISQILEGKAKKGIVPELWDGHAAERIVSILLGVAL